MANKIIDIEKLSRYHENLKEVLNTKEAAGAAAQALADAKADAASLYQVKGDYEAAGTAAGLNAAMDERVVKLEAIDHDKIVADAIAAVVAGAESDFDTLKEVADWINNDTTGAAALQVAVSEHADAIESLSEDKQDNISDLETIRSGVAAGATALQSYTEQYKGTVTGVKINGTTKNPSSGVVDLGSVITAHQALKTINGETIVGSGDITISGGSSDANIQAVDTGDVIDDVNVEYATKTYVDGLIGDICSVLESIINGGSVLITFTIDGIECQAEEGMTFHEWAISDYYNESVAMRSLASPYISLREYCLNNADTGGALCDGQGAIYPGITTSTIIQDGGEYNVDSSGFPM